MIISALVWLHHSTQIGDLTCQAATQPNSQRLTRLCHFSLHIFSYFQVSKWKMFSSKEKNKNVAHGQGGNETRDDHIHHVCLFVRSLVGYWNTVWQYSFICRVGDSITCDWCSRGHYSPSYVIRACVLEAHIELWALGGPLDPVSMCKWTQH